MSTREPGVPLAHFLDDHPGVDVALSCDGCGAKRVLPMAGVVARLTARGRDPRTVGICEIAELVEQPCKCGKRAWSTRPQWPPAQGAAHAAADDVEETSSVTASYATAKGR